LQLAVSSLTEPGEFIEERHDGIATGWLPPLNDRRRIQIGDRIVVCEAWSLIALQGHGAGMQLSVEVRGTTWRKSDLPEDRPRVARVGITSNLTGAGLDLYHANKPDGHIMELPK
jgi:hypothetical protein